MAVLPCIQNKPQARVCVTIFVKQNSSVIVFDFLQYMSILPKVNLSRRLLVMVVVLLSSIGWVNAIQFLEFLVHKLLDSHMEFEFWVKLISRISGGVGVAGHHHFQTCTTVSCCTCSTIILCCCIWYENHITEYALMDNFSTWILAWV